LLPQDKNADLQADLLRKSIEHGKIVHFHNLPQKKDKSPSQIGTFANIISTQPLWLRKNWGQSGEWPPRYNNMEELV
jgi:hypothetical protein